MNRTARLRAAVVLLVVVPLTTGCGAGQLTADSLCSDYLQRPHEVRYDTAIRLSSELHVQDAGSPFWPVELDYECGHHPKEPLHTAFGR